MSNMDHEGVNFSSLNIEDGKSFLSDLENILKNINNKFEAVNNRLDKIDTHLSELIIPKEYTIAEVAHLTGKHHSTVRNWIEKGLLEYKRTGKIYTITHQSLQEFIKNSKGIDPLSKIYKSL